MISRLCYELYKIDWRYTYIHLTKEKEMDAVKDYYAGLIDNESVYSYNDYLEEFGYNDELYACYEEFLTAEYLDAGYICSLLGDAKLIAMYYLDNTNKKIGENIKFEERCDSKTYGTTTFYFIAPKELLADKYPEAEFATISVECPSDKIESDFATVMISPGKYCEEEDALTDYNWQEYSLSEAEIDALIELASQY